jgi:hypothetical protein
VSAGGVFNWVAHRSGAGITVRGCDADGQPVTLTGVTSIYVVADGGGWPTVFAHGPGQAHILRLHLPRRTQTRSDNQLDPANHPSNAAEP